jgi:hypothetical protein
MAAIEATSTLDPACCPPDVQKMLQIGYLLHVLLEEAEQRQSDFIRCGAVGHVDMDSLSERARDNYLYVLERKSNGLTSAQRRREAVRAPRATIDIRLDSRWPRAPVGDRTWQLTLGANRPVGQECDRRVWRTGTPGQQRYFRGRASNVG